MRPPVPATFLELDVRQAYLRPRRSEDVNCDSRRELRQATALFFPGSPRTRFHSDKEVPQDRSTGDYASIARRGLTLGGRRSRQRERSRERSCGNEPNRDFRAVIATATGERCP